VKVVDLNCNVPQICTVYFGLADYLINNQYTYKRDDIMDL